MKLKNLFLGALLTLTVAPAFAQAPLPTKPEDIQAEAAKLIKGGDAKAVAAFAKNYKKNPTAQSCIAKAYLEAKDLTNAQAYADKALEIVNNNKKTTEEDKGNTYIALGMIAAAKNDASNTAMWYQQAMYGDPKNPTGYRLYATTVSKSDPRGAIDALETLRKNRPDYPVDLIAAEIAANAGQKKKALEYYAKVKIADMKPYQVGNYAFNLYMDQQTQKAVDVSVEGLKASPRSATLNRIAFWGNTDLKKWDQALFYSDKLFNASDSVKIVSDDYGRLINALRGAGKFDEALVQLNKLANDPAMPKADQLFALKQIAQTYSDKEDYDNAIPAYQKYLAACDKPSPTDIAALGQQYMYAAEKTPAKKMELLKKADEVFAGMESNPDAKEYAIYKRAQVANQMDGGKGLAKQFYDQILEMPDANKSRVKEAYLYNISYFGNVKNDLNAAVPYAQKLQELDPENPIAKQVIDAANMK